MAMALSPRYYNARSRSPANNNNLQFDAKEENFTSFKQRLENYFKLADVPEYKKPLELINCLGAKHYQLLADLTKPALPNTKPYYFLIYLLEEHICPLLKVQEQYHVDLIRQKENQTVPEFASDLQRSFSIVFEGFKDLALRAGFIVGLRDITIRVKLLEDKKVSFDESVKIARTIESSTKSYTKPKDIPVKAVPVKTVNILEEPVKESTCDHFDEWYTKVRSSKFPFTLLDSYHKPPLGLTLHRNCFQCGSSKDKYLCLNCDTVLCGVKSKNHMKSHSSRERHHLALGLEKLSVWCYSCRSYMDNKKSRMFKKLFK